MPDAAGVPWPMVLPIAEPPQPGHRRVNLTLIARNRPHLRRPLWESIQQHKPQLAALLQDAEFLQVRDECARQFASVVVVILPPEVTAGIL